MYVQKICTIDLEKCLSVKRALILAKDLDSVPVIHVGAHNHQLQFLGIQHSLLTSGDTRQASSAQTYMQAKYSCSLRYESLIYTHMNNFYKLKTAIVVGKKMTH